MDRFACCRARLCRRLAGARARVPHRWGFKPVQGRRRLPQGRGAGCLQPACVVHVTPDNGGWSRAGLLVALVVMCLLYLLLGCSTPPSAPPGAAPDTLEEPRP